MWIDWHKVAKVIIKSCFENHLGIGEIYSLFTVYLIFLALECEEYEARDSHAIGFHLFIVFKMLVFFFFNHCSIWHVT